MMYHCFGAEGTSPMLPPVPNLDGKKIRAWYSPTALAFLGDSVWEVRTLLAFLEYSFTATVSVIYLCCLKMPILRTCYRSLCPTSGPMRYRFEGQ